MVKNILLLLFASICISAVAQTPPKFKLITTQYSRGLDNGREYIQFVVAAKQTCSETKGGDSIANIGNYIIKDPNADSTFTLNGSTYPSIAFGKYRFPNTPTWDSIAFGSIIVVYNDLLKNNNFISSFVDDSTGKIHPHWYVIPVSWLDSSFNPDSVPPTPDSILTTPAGLNLQPGQYCYLAKPIYPVDTTLPPQYLNLVSNWKVATCGTAPNNEQPTTILPPINSWVLQFQKVAVQTLTVSISNPTDSICPNRAIVYRGNISLPLNEIQYEWDINGVKDSVDLISYDSLYKNLFHNDTVTLKVSTPLKCIAGHISGDTVSVVTWFIGELAPPLTTTINTTPLPIIGTDSLATKTDTLGVVHPDSSIVYKTFCKGTKVTFLPTSNQPYPTDAYFWFKNGVFIANDSTYVDSTLNDHDSIMCVLKSAINKCIDDSHDTTIIRLRILDSIPLPKLTITGDDSICSGVTDSFAVKFTYPTGARDTTARYQIQWLVNNNVALQDPAIYKDGDTVAMYKSSTLNQGDSIQVILLANKTASCPYYSGAFVNPPDSLIDSSNKVGITVTQTITPAFISLTATQTGLCPDSILTKLHVHDTILFTAVTDTVSAGFAPLYYWYINGKQVTDSSVLTFSRDTTTFLSKGLLHDSDVVSVILINTTYKCVTSDTARDSLQLFNFNPLPQPTAQISANPISLCAAGLPPNVTFTATGVTNGGVHPAYKWYEGIDTLTPLKFVSDSSAYVVNKIVNNDSILLVLTSSVACATPKDTTAGYLVTIAQALTPSVTIPNAPLTYCANQPPTISPTPVNGGSSPQYTWYMVGTNGNPDSLIGTSSGDFALPALNDDTSLVLTWKVYCQMVSNASCLATTNANSDTVTVTINPVPNVSPIVGPSSVCQGAYITLSDAPPTSGGNWLYNWVSTNQSTATVDQAGKVTGVNVGSATIIYTVINQTTLCGAGQPFTVTINPTDVLFDSLTHFNICIGSNDTIYNDSTHGVWGITPTSAPVTVVASVNANTGRPIGLVTATTNGLVIITDTIINDCGTTVRYDTIVVGPPVIDSITGARDICTIGGTSQLQVYQHGATSSSWFSNNPGVATVDNSGLVTAVGAGTAVIIYTANDDCSLSSGTPATMQVTINVGPPTDPGSISGGTSILCIGSSTVGAPFIDNIPGGVWSSDNKKIATIDSITGIATGVGIGQDSIRYTVGNKCGSVSVEVLMSVQSAYVLPKIQGDTIVCNGVTTQYTDAVSGGVWGFVTDPNGLATIDQQGNLTTTSTSGLHGIDTITYSVTNTCGTKIDSLIIVIGKPLIGALSYMDSICQGSTTVVSTIGTRGATYYNWISLNPSVAAFINNSDTILGKKGGNATFFYQIGNVCDTITSSVFNPFPITVVSLPGVSPIAGKSIVCFGDTAKYSDTAANGVWSVNSSIATINNAGTLQSISGGNAVVTYKVTNSNGCSDSMTKAVTLDTLISVAPITGAGSIFCTRKIVNLTDATAAGTWFSSDTTIAKVDSMMGSVLGVNSGTATIRYVVKDGYGCDTAKSVSITVFPTPTVTPIIASKDTLCGNESVQYSNITSGGVWVSTIPSVATVSAGLVTGLKFGQDSILYIVSAASCSDTAFKPIAVDTIPVVAPITGADNVCYGRMVTLNDITPSGTWASSDLSIAAVNASGVVTGISAGTTKIKYIVGDSYNCKDSVSTNFVVNPIPTIDSIKGLVTLCVGKQWQFTDGASGGVWSNTTGAVSVSSTGLVTAVIPDISDTIKYKVVKLGCDTTVSFPIAITIPHVAPITADTLAIPVGLTIDLKDDSIPGFWTSALTNIATVDSIASGVGRVTGVTKGTDSIIYTYVDPTGCQASTKIQITILDQLNDIYAPNFFNPNSANTGNKTFMILGKDMLTLELKVFSPWGEILYETKDPSAIGWDGTNKHGSVMPTGVYVYTAKITLKNNGKVINKKGAINLIR